MAATNKQKTAAAQWAKALLELANEQQQAEAIGTELRQIKELMAAEPTFGLFLRDPSIGQAERWQTLERIFAAQVSPLLLNAIGVMNSKNRLGLLVAIADCYQALLDEQLGRINVSMTVAQPLDAAAMEEVSARVGAAFKKQAQVRQVVDESIIGGIVLRIDDKLIDGSVRSQLESLKRQLMATAPRP